MKQVFLKAAFLLLVIFIVSAIAGSFSTNACDKKLFTKNCILPKKAEQKKPAVVSNETAVYTDFILTNSILRF
jgi:hypothetical protein